MAQGNTKSWSDPKVWLVALAIVALTSVVIVAIIRDRIVNQDQWQVSVNGQGKVSYTPDQATIQLGVQVDKQAKAEDALKQLSDKIAGVTAAVKAAGIPDEDIQTQSYSLYPQYDYVNQASTLLGYSANQQLTIKVRHITNGTQAVANIISVATKAGANQVGSVTFDVSNLEDLKQQARVRAIQDAKQKANALADAAGVRLKNVIGWWENVIQVPGTPTPYYGGDKGGMGGGPTTPTTVPTGDQEVIIEIGLNYRIK